MPAPDFGAAATREQHARMISAIARMRSALSSLDDYLSTRLDIHGDVGDAVAVQLCRTAVKAADELAQVRP